MILWAKGSAFFEQKYEFWKILLWNLSISFDYLAK